MLHRIAFAVVSEWYQESVDFTLSVVFQVCRSDDDEAGARCGQEHEACGYERGPADEVDYPPILRRLTLLATTAVAMVAGLKARARFDLLEEPPRSYRLLEHIPPSTQCGYRSTKRELRFRALLNGGEASILLGVIRTGQAVPSAVSAVNSIWLATTP
jgi:hypothetical protein